LLSVYDDLVKTLGPAIDELGSAETVGFAASVASSGR
jgi:hypothetical protein